MLLDDKEIEGRLDSESNLINIVKLRHGGAGPRIPPKVNDLLGIIGSKSSTRETAEVFDVDKSEVNEEVRNRKLNNPNQEEIETEALGIMLDSLKAARNRISEVSKPEKLVRMASDASKIISNIKDKKEQEGGTKVLVQVYAPIVRSENDYEMVKV